MRKLTLILLSIFLVGWAYTPAGVTVNSTTNFKVATVRNQTIGYWKFNTTGCSGWLAVDECSKYTMSFDPSVGGNTINIRETNDNTTSCGNGTLVTIDRDGDGVLSASDQLVWSGTVNNAGFGNRTPGPRYVGVEVIAASGATELVSITCNR